MSFTGSMDPISVVGFVTVVIQLFLAMEEEMTVGVSRDEDQPGW